MLQPRDRKCTAMALLNVPELELPWTRTVLKASASFEDGNTFTLNNNARA